MPYYFKYLSTYSNLLRCYTLLVTGQVASDVSNDHIAFIFRIKLEVRSLKGPKRCVMYISNTDIKVRNVVNCASDSPYDVLL